MVRHLLVFIIVAIALPAMASAVEKKQWTIMFYMVGEEGKKSSAAEDAIINDMLTLSSIGSSESVNFVVQVDRGSGLSSLMKKYYDDPNYSGAVRYSIEKDKWVVHEKIGEVNSGHPQTLWDFMTWSASLFPAEHYGLVISSHGSGLLSWSGPGSVSDRPGYVEPFGDEIQPAPISPQFVGYDSHDKDCITPFELKAVLEKFRSNINDNRKLDFIAFDACDPATIENLYQLRNSVDYLIGSESTIPMSGLTYKSMAMTLIANPNVTAEQLGATLCEAFVNSNDQASIMGSFSTAEIGTFVEQLNLLAQEMSIARHETKISINGLISFFDGTYWDIKSILESIIAGRNTFTKASNYSRIVSAAEAAKKGLTGIRSSLWYSGYFADRKSGGLSIYWPTKKYDQYRAFYQALDMSKDFEWDEFLDGVILGTSDEGD